MRVKRRSRRDGPWIARIVSPFAWLPTALEFAAAALRLSGHEVVSTVPLGQPLNIDRHGLLVDGRLLSIRQVGENAKEHPLVRPTDHLH